MGTTEIHYIDVNRYEREALKITTRSKGYPAKTCPVCGKVLANPSWKVCKSCYSP